MVAYSHGQARYLAIMLNPDLPATYRALLGRRINELPNGDPRPGVQNFNWEDAYWCHVPAGEFQMGAYERDLHTTVIPYPYWVGKYLITYAQFKLFLDDPEGYENDLWWQVLHPEALQSRDKNAIQHWKIANHPAERVSWYDCMAFCQWLTAQWRAGNVALPDSIPPEYVLRLPTEPEWEKAARGTDGRDHPWGYSSEYPEDEVEKRANIAALEIVEAEPFDCYPHPERDIRQTSAVGIYPHGASPYGVLDVLGNVKQWCLNQNAGGEVNLGSNMRRGLRGTDWYCDRNYTNLGSGDVCGREPNTRYEIIGFRIVASVDLYAS